MRIAALILGIIGGLLGLFVGLFGYGIGTLGQAMGDSSGGVRALISLAIPVASIVGGAIALRLPVPAGVLMLVGGVGMFLMFGFGFFTAFSIMLSVIGGGLALMDVVQNPTDGR